jgi:hypothetical protein
MDKRYKELLMIIAISLVFLNIQLFVQPQRVSKIAICNEKGSTCSSVETGSFRRG